MKAIPDLKLLRGRPTVPLAPEPPAYLALTERALWARLQAEYGLIDGPAILLLDQLARNLQMVRECREQVEREGKMVGKREHPLLRTMAMAEARAASALKSLHFDVEPVRDMLGRPGGSARRR